MGADDTTDQDCSVSRRARIPLVPASGAGVSFRFGVPLSRQSVGASTDTGVHAALRCRGGARIGAPRAKVSMTIMAAPQSNNSRALARCARRAALAIRP